MVTESRTGAHALVEALQRRPDVVALTLFGSFAREDRATTADGDSDMDLQVICHWPEVLSHRDWAESVLGEGELLAWSPRAALGGVTKVSILLAKEEVDLVLVSVGRIRWARWGMALGLHHRFGWARRLLGPLVLVMGPGYRVLKGGSHWEKFWRQLVHEVSEPSIGDRKIQAAEDAALVDLRSIQRKLARGELRAAQRWLHNEMAARNFELMHELRRRRGEVSFFDGRRVETILSAEDISLVTIDASLNRESLGAAAEQAAAATRILVARVLAESRERGARS